MTSETSRLRRGGGRAARKAARSDEAEQINPCPPGQIGGQYKPLTDSDIERIYQTALKILDEIGMADVPDVLMEKAMAKGASINALDRLSFSQIIYRRHN